MNARLEHVNFTVSDPMRTAELLCALFDWRIRWRGPAADGGNTVHVGTDEDYLALYSDGTQRDPADIGALNHVGVVVDDLEAAERRVSAAGLEPHSFCDYEPGRRFYFNDRDGVEYEVVSYA
ncbi:MAG TPA: VOC family protein [Parvularculaceae bacterium]|nr:VOC family protein [Parvularculaceae bacterium]